MPNLKDIRVRIASVKNTRKITKAMKMVASAKLRRAQERMQSSRPYAVKMGQVIASLASRVEEGTHPLLDPREERSSILVVVITSNRGLCGGFNTNLLREVDRFLDDREVAGEQIHIVTVGRKAHDHFKRSRHEVVANRSELIGDVTFKKAQKVARGFINDFMEKQYDAVFLCFNKFVSAIASDRIIAPVLPLSMDHEDFGGDDDDDAITVTGSGEFIYEPDVETLLGRLLPSHVELQFMQALYESEASEHAARMTAMDNATNNAGDMIDSLTLQYNRARQAYITREIVEIVSGAESLKG